MKKLNQNDIDAVTELVGKAIEKSDAINNSMPKIRREINDFVNTTYVTQPFKKSKIFKKKTSKGMKFAFGIDYLFLFCFI